MSSAVQIQWREAQSYAAIPMLVTMDTLARAVDQAFPELFGWLAEHAIEPAGPPLIRYLVVDMATGLQVEMGYQLAQRSTATAASSQATFRPGSMQSSGTPGPTTA